MELKLNMQDREGPVVRADGLLDVVNIFPTVQGEGPFAGRPSVFVRTAGCNLMCPFCDTQYTFGRKMMTVADMVAEVARLMPAYSNLVVLTGGEPFRQDVAPLVRELLFRHNEVQIETNGTMACDDLPWASPHLTVVCSPKTPSVHPRLADKAIYLKYVLQAGRVDDSDGLPTTTLGNGTRVWRPSWMPADLRRRTYVQPLDEKDEAKNKANAAACVASATRFGYTVSIQQHKSLGLE